VRAGKPTLRRQVYLHCYGKRIRSTETAAVPSKHDPAASLADILENLEQIEDPIKDGV
jgi:hypothetical protein